MIDRLESVWRAAVNAADLVIHHAASVGLGWLALGVALHLVSQAVRTVGWFHIIRAAYPDARELRRRDVISAYLAGAGLNGVVPARGGDVVKLFFVRRKVERSSYSTLAGTFVPETLFETTLGVALVVWALVRGFLPVPTSTGEFPSLDVSLVIAHPIISAGVAGGLAFGAVALVGWLRRRSRGFLARVRQGLAILGTPGRYVRSVVSWQALGRLVRLGSLAAFMAAFQLPVTITTVVLVMAAQGGGRIIPLAPASAGLRLVMLSYGFVEVTGQPIDIARITAFSFGVSFVLLVVGLAVSLAIIAGTMRTLSPRRALLSARAVVAAHRAEPERAAA